MKTSRRLAFIISTVALLALPALASAQVYYYAPNTTSGAFNYGSSFNSSVPASAMPYVQLGYQMQSASPAGGQQSQSQSQSQYQYYQPSSYSYPSPYLYQSQPTYPSYENYMMPSYYSYQQPYSYDEYDSSYDPYEMSYSDEYDMPTCYDSYSCGSYSEDPYVVY